MKNVCTKRLLALAMTAAITVSLLAGCGQQKEENSDSKDGSGTEYNMEEKDGTGTNEGDASETDFVHDPVLNELGVEPFVKEEVTITIGITQNADVEDYDTNYYTQMLEEVTGVNIEFVIFPSGEDGNNKLQMMISGNQTLPDILLKSQSDTTAMEWGAEGYLVPLEEYFANSSQYAAEGYARVLEQSGLDILDYMTLNDGHIWSFPTYFESTTNPAYARIWVYEPWLEELGLDRPTTTEEFRDMLEAFKTKDPNGNGKADEIPMLGSTPSSNSTGSEFLDALMNAFVHSTSRKNFLISTDGILSVSYNQEEWKEGVKYIRDLVADGLIDPVSFTQTSDVFKQVMNGAGEQLVGCFVYISDSFIGTDHASKQNWILLEPLTGPDGFCSTSYVPDLPSNKAYITADCEHPEVAFRILDLMCREDFTITARWGKQGENWDYVEDIANSEEFSDKDFSQTWMGYPAYIYEYKSIWNQPENIHWMNDQVAFRTAEVAAGWYASNLDPDTNYTNYQLSQYLSSYEEAAPEEKITKIKFDSIDSETEATEILGSLKGYVYENLAHWCLGDSDVDADWNSYLSELEEIGLSDWLEIQQAGWK